MLVHSINQLAGYTASHIHVSMQSQWHKNQPNYSFVHWNKQTNKNWFRAYFWTFSPVFFPSTGYAGLPSQKKDRLTNRMFKFYERKKTLERLFHVGGESSDWLCHWLANPFPRQLLNQCVFEFDLAVDKRIAWFQQFRLKFHSNRLNEMPKRHLTSKSTYWIIKRNIEIKSNGMEWNVSATAGDKIWYSFVC